MRLYVHIGTHKTGTTSIQCFLREHADALAEAGVYVPCSGVPTGHCGHHNIPWQMRGDSRFDLTAGTVDDLIAELANRPSQAAVISSEDFEYLVEQPAALTRLHRALTRAGHDVEYILSVRRPDHYALSLYAELRGHGLAEPFSGFVLEILRTGRLIMHGSWCFYFDMDAFRAKWSEATARAQLHVYSYDEALRGAGVLPAFLSRIGAPGPVIDESVTYPRLNTRKPANVSGLDRLVCGWRLRGRFKRVRLDAAH